MNVLLLTALLLLPLVLGLGVGVESDDDLVLHFSDLQHGRAVWIVDESTLPWIGSYDYLRLNNTAKTVLLTVVDSSTGRTLGECSEVTGESGWSSIRWLLKPDSLLCTISPNNSSRAVFPLSSGSRSFSVRIKADSGPLCIRDLRIQNERSVGCPPHVAVSSFSSLHLNCSCPFEAATDPPFPLFELGGSEPSAMPVWTVSPCADFICMNNGTCVVAQEGTAACLCRDGFIGAICEIDLCSSVPCQNGGRCQATGGEARCECLPNFTGILCESVAEVCEMPCMNGMCVIEDNKERCECRQGFMGVSCSVIDVCLGDGACALFGPDARCVVDEASFAVTSTHLQNASYECRCPHPVNGEYVDCLALHLSTSVSESITDVSTPMSVNIGFGQTTFVPSEAVVTTATMEETEDPAWLTSLVPQTPLLHRITFPPSMPPTGHPSFQTSQEQATPMKFAVHPTTEEEQLTTSFAMTENSENMVTSASSNIPSGSHSIPSNSSFAGFISTQLLPTTATSASTTRLFVPSTTMTMSPVPTAPSFQSLFTSAPTTRFSTVSTTEPSTMQFVPHTNAVPYSAIPSWMTVTQPSWTSSSSISSTPELVTTSTPTTTPTTTATTTIQTTSSTTQNVTQNKDAGKITKPVVAGDYSGHRSSAASWIIAIVAMIVLGFLLLATTLFVLRYVRQSRKLHGKYNPAREEHALSAAFSMPMSHISKEERLI